MAQENEKIAIASHRLTTEEKKALDKKIADKQKLITDKKIIIK